MKEECEGFKIGTGAGIGCEEICQDERADIITSEQGRI